MLGSACGICERCIEYINEVKTVVGIKTTERDYDQLLADARELHRSLWEITHVSGSMTEHYHIAKRAFETFTKKYGGAE